MASPTRASQRTSRHWCVGWVLGCKTQGLPCMCSLLSSVGLVRSGLGKGARKVRSGAWPCGAAVCWPGMGLLPRVDPCRTSITRRCSSRRCPPACTPRRTPAPPAGLQLEQIATSATAEQGLGYLSTREALNLSLGWAAGRAGGQPAGRRAGLGPRAAALHCIAAMHKPCANAAAPRSASGRRA